MGQTVHPDTTLAGRWALQFQVNDNFSLKSFQGSIISAKWRRSAHSAFRLGVSLRGHFLDGDTETSEQDTLINEANREDTNWSFGISGQYITKLDGTEGITPFIGIGPTVSFGGSNDQRTTTFLSQGVVQDRTIDIENRNWQAGVVGVLGVEWFLCSEISISAEYGVSIQYRKEESESSFRRRSLNPTDIIEDTIDKTDLSGFEISPQNVLLGVSLYF